ncbi:MAG: InlB B-repeat-containing protein [Lachnospirales bacterium]
MNAEVRWRDDPQAKPTYETKSNAVLNTDPTNNTATLYIHGFTNNAFYVVRDIRDTSASLTGFEVYSYAPNQGHKKATEAKATIDTDDTYAFEFDYNMTIEGTYTSTYKTSNSSTLTDAFHGVSYEIVATGYEGVIAISGSATDNGGSDHGYVEAYDVKTDDGTGVTIISDTANGYDYRIVGWKDKTDAARAASVGGKISMPDRDMVLVPVFQNTDASAKAITFHANGGSIKYLGTEDEPTGAIYNGQLLTEADCYGDMAVTREGYRLVGWSTDDNADNAVNIATYPAGTDTLDVYAVWEIKDDIVVTFDGNGGYFGNEGILTKKVGPGTYGETLAAPTVRKDGYSFEGWFETASPAAGTAPIDTSSMTYPAESTVYYAKWTALDQDVVFDRGTNGKFKNSQDATLTYQIATDELVGNSVATADIEIEANDGYDFLGWFDGTSLYSVGEALGVEVPDKGITFTARYAPRGAGVIFFDYAGGKDTANGTSKLLAKPAGSALASSDVPTVTRTGYTFSKWVDEQGNEVDTVTLKYPAEGATTKLYADWTPNDISVQFVQGEHGTIANAGGGTVPAGKKISEGSVNIPTPTADDGWEFSGLWQSSEDGSIYKTADVSGYEVSGANARVTFTALYNEIGKHTIIYVLGDGTYEGKSTVTVPGKMGATVTKLDTTKIVPPTGWKFTGWDATEPTTFGTAGEVTILNAVYEAQKYTVTFNANNGATPVPTETQEITYGTPTALTTIRELRGFTKDGSEFRGWAESATGAVAYSDGSQVTDLGDTTLYAVWETKQVTVTFMANDEVVARKTGKAGITTITPPANPTKSGYTFDGWYDGDTKIDFESTTAPVFPNADATYVAKFEANKYKVTFHDGTATKEQSFTYDVKGNLDANSFTKAGSTFQGWATENGGAVKYADGAEVVNLIATANGNVDLYAVWTVNGHSISYDYDGGTVATANPAGANAGDTVNLTAPTKTGYSPIATASPWTVKTAGGTTVTVTNNSFTMPDDDVTVSYKFKANEYKVIFHVNEGTGTDEQEQTFTYDANETALKSLEELNITREGYNFLGWSRDSGATSASYADGALVRNLSTGDPVDLYAVWSINEYAISYDYDGGALPAGAASNADKAEYGDSITLTVPEKFGYEFKGWISDDVNIANNSFKMPAKNVAIKADWEALSNTVKFTAEEGGKVTTTPASTTRYSGSTVNIEPTAANDPGYSFDGYWLLKETGELLTAAQIKTYEIVGENDTFTFEAQFTLNKNGTIFIDFNGGEAGGKAYYKTSAPGESEIGTAADEIAALFGDSGVKKDGYTITGLKLNDADVDLAAFLQSPPTTYPAAGEMDVYQLQWTADKNTVKFVVPHAAPNGNETEVAVWTGDAGVPTDETLLANNRTLPTVEVAEGYVFKNQWECSEGGTFTLADMAKYTMPAKDVTFTAVVVHSTELASSWKLSFDAGEGAFDGENPLSVENGKTVSLGSYKATAPDGKLFDGWADETGAKITSIVMDADKTVYAVYKDDTSVNGKFTVTFSAGANGKFANEQTEITVEVAKDTAISETIEEPTAEENYTFIGWTTAASGDAIIPTAAIAMIPVTENVTYTASYTKTGPIDEVEYTLIFDTNGSEDSFEAITLPKGEKVDVSVFVPTAPTDKVFDGWTLNNRVVNVVTLDGDKTVIARYSDVVKYDVTFQEEDGTQIGETVKVVSGESVTTVPTAATIGGKTFLGWTIGRDATVYTDDAVKGMAITRATTFKAKYADDTAATSTLKFDTTTNGGSGTVNDVTQPVGTKLSLTGYTATPADGYDFVGWNTDQNATTAQADYTFTDTDATVYAIYAAKPAPTTYTVKFMNGTDELSSQTVNEGECATAPTAPTAPAGQKFAGWKDETGTVYTEAGVNGRGVTADVTYTAYFKNADAPVVTTKTLTFDANGGKDAPAAMTLPTGTKVQLTGLVATPPTGREFNGWKLNGALVTEVTLDADKTVVADYTVTNPAGPFTVTFSAGSNGKMSPETYSEQVVGGNTVTSVPTITANSSYTFEGWTLNGGGTKYNSADVAAMKITGDSDFVAYYSKTTTGGGGGGGGGQTIEVPVDNSCKQDETCLLSEYRDLDPKAWYHDGVHFVIENKIMTGTGDKVFEPNAAVTRAQIVTILWRLEGSPVSGRHSFSDVASGSWYDQAVAWAAANGIVNGYDAKTFGPGDDITREQFATIMHRYASFKGYSTSAAANLSRYTDAGSISSWAQAAMRWANAEGLITGTTATTLDPGGNATRAQAACIIQRFCENVAK